MSAIIRGIQYTGKGGVGTAEALTQVASGVTMLTSEAAQYASKGLGLVKKIFGGAVSPRRRRASASRAKMAASPARRRRTASPRRPKSPRTRASPHRRRARSPRSRRAASPHQRKH